jgi:hypothetical protein
MFNHLAYGLAFPQQPEERIRNPVRSYAVNTAALRGLAAKRRKPEKAHIAEL